MNHEWARATLNAYAEACFTVETPKTSTDEAGIEAAYKIIDTLEPLVMRIINAYGMDGDPDDEDWGYAASGGMAQAAADLAEEHADLLRLDLGPCAPYIPADGLHASVWEAARPMWQAGATQDAVNAAARAVNARIQRKVGRRDVSDYELAMQVFDSQAPKPGKPRLRLPGDRSSQTWKSQQEGIKFFAAGCFRAIRNPGVHESELDWSEQQAFEYLAALSVLARWVDLSTVETGLDVRAGQRIVVEGL